MHQPLVGIGLLALAIIMATVAAGSLLPGVAPMLPWYSPTVTHVLAYAVIGGLLRLLLTDRRHASVHSLLWAGGFGVCMELAQVVMPFREFSFKDMLSNVGGAMLGIGGAFMLLLASRRRRNPGKHFAAVPTPSTQAAALAGRLQRLADDRLLQAAPLLNRREWLSSVEAELAAKIASRVPAIGNQPAVDREVMEALVRARARPLLLKGTLLAHTVYETPEQRARGDTDILVAPASRKLAEHVLRELGFSCGWERTAKTSDTQDQWVRTGDTEAAVIDLHWYLLNHPAFSDLLSYDTLWTGRQPVRLEGATVAGLGRVHALLHAILHYYIHHDDTFRPRQWLLDMDLLWRAMPSGEREEFSESVQVLGVSGLAANAMQLSATEFGTPVTHNLLTTWQEQGRRQWRTAALHTGHSRFARLSFPLKAELSLRRRLRYLRTLLLPSPLYMQHKYPESPKWLLPWLYVKRVIDALGR